ncbi:MAG: hypothetical protein FD180_324 [Planctomycetota bacterium]|nr:MAG: hypothetical protein FD180_324 [Planctomycetota bacterium]
MWRNVLAGAVAGAAITSLALRAFEKPQPQVSRANIEKQPDNVAGQLERDISKVNLESDHLRTRIAALKQAPKTVPGKEVPAAPTTRSLLKQWRDQVKDLYEALSGIRSWSDAKSSAVERSMNRAYKSLDELAHSRGMSRSDVMQDSEGLPRLAEAFLRELDLPQDVALITAIGSLLTDTFASWEELLAKRDSQSHLEQFLEMDAFRTRFFSSFRALLSSDQRREVFELHGRPDFISGRGHPFEVIDTTWANARGPLTDLWMKQFGLEESQRGQLQPVVDAFLEEDQVIHAPLEEDRVVKNSELGEAYRKTMEAQIRAQQRIQRDLRLTDAQSKAVREWAVLYEIRIPRKEGGKLGVVEMDEEE